MLFAPELHLGRDALVPNLTAWRRERLPELPDVPAMTLAPDCVCQVLSPPTEILDRVRKMGSDARESVKHLWLGDRRIQLLEVYQLDEKRWSLLGAYLGDTSVRAQPFEAIELKLNLLWER